MRVKLVAGRWKIRAIPNPNSQSSRPALGRITCSTETGRHHGRRDDAWNWGSNYTLFSVELVVLVVAPGSVEPVRRRIVRNVNQGLLAYWPPGYQSMFGRPNVNSEASGPSPINPWIHHPRSKPLLRGRNLVECPCAPPLIIIDRPPCLKDPTGTGSNAMPSYQRLLFLFRNITHTPSFRADLPLSPFIKGQPYHAPSLQLKSPVAHTETPLI